MAALNLGVSQLIFSSSANSVRSAKVRITAPGAGNLETGVVRAAGQQPLRFDWTQRVPVNRGGRVWEALESALRARPGVDSKVDFSVFNVDTSTEVGKASVDLRGLATFGAHEKEAASQKLNVVDAHGRAQGTLIVQVRALEAVRLVLGGPQVADDVRKTFNDFDRDGSGDIDPSELRAALQRLGLGSVDSASAKAILSKYDADGSRLAESGRGSISISQTLDLSEFSRLVSDLRSYKSKSGASSSPSRGGASSSASLDSKVRVAFDAFDVDKSGDIDVTELKGALKHLGLNADSKAAEQVLRRYSGGGRSTLTYDQFYKLVQDLQSYQGGSSSGAAASPTRASPGSSSAVDPHVAAAFREFDADGSGDIDAKELTAALKVLGLRADSAGALQVLQSYASKGTSTLTLTQFDKLVKDLEKYQGGASPIRRTSLARKGIEPRTRTAFERYDRDGSGDIDGKELMSALRDLGMTASEAQARAILQKYDVNQRSGTLDIFEFDKLVRDLSRFSGGSGKASASRGASGGQVVDPKVRAAFERFDTDGSGGIDASELRRALSHLGVQADGAQARKILARYDTQQVDASLDLFEFDKLVADLVAYQGGGQPTGGVAIEESVRLAFARFDADGSGRIDAQELRLALVQLGVQADGPQAVKVLRRYDADGSGGIELREFAQLVRDLVEYQGGGTSIPHEVRKAFGLFDRDGSGSIDASELRSALHHLGIEANSSQALSVLKEYDADGNRSLDLAEFAKLVHNIREFQSGNRKDQILTQLQGREVAELFRLHRATLDELFSAFAQRDEGALTKAHLSHADEEVRAAFAAFDRDGSGGIDARELTGALMKLGMQTTSAQAEKVLARYDQDASRTLELTEFRSLVTDLRRYEAATTHAYRYEGGARGTMFEAEARALTIEELLSMLYGFRVVPERLLDEEVRQAVREMQTTSSAHVSLQPFKRLLFDECLLRLAHAASARSTSLQGAEAHRRLDDLLRALYVHDLPTMRSLMRTHMLSEACTVGDLRKVERLLAEGTQPDGRGHDGTTALHRAAMYGHEGAVELLIKGGASLPLRSSEGFTAMHWAAEFGHAPVVRLLLRGGAAPSDSAEDTAWTPLHRASLDGHTAVVRTLLEAGCPAGPRDKDGDTPLHDAARNGHLSVVKALVGGGSPLDAPNFMGKSALDLAKQAGRSAVADYLSVRMRGQVGRGLM